MLHEKKKKHSQKQQASNLIASELIKTNKDSCFQKNSKNSEVNENTHIALYIVFEKASEIHIVELYSCDWSWSWSRYKLRILLRFQAANKSSSVTVFFFKLKIIKKKISIISCNAIRFFVFVYFELWFKLCFLVVFEQQHFLCFVCLMTIVCFHFLLI